MTPATLRILSDSTIAAMVRNTTDGNLRRIIGIKRPPHPARATAEQWAASRGNVWRPSHMAAEVGVSRQTVTEWLAEMVATARTYEEWFLRYGCVPAERLRTEIGVRDVKSSNPGYCYKCAGWERDRIIRGKLYMFAPLVVHVPTTAPPKQTSIFDLFTTEAA